MDNILKKIGIPIVLVLGGITLAAQSRGPGDLDALRIAPFLEITAKAGDNLPILLERYELEDAACNTTQFFKLNRLKDGDYRLKAGKVYQMPIQVVQYNGKSIRTTLGISDIAAAKRIDVYNKALQKKGLRTDNFIESRRLWVPWHEFNCTNGESKKPLAEAQVPGATGAAVVAGGEIATGADKRTFPIFGPAYQRTPLVSNRLKGRVFYLISGHGGPDPGAQGKRAGTTLCEDEYAYDVTLRLLRFLISHGATAYMIVRDVNDGIRDDVYLKCDKDEIVWGNKKIPVNQKERLAQRTDVVNALTAQHNKKGQKEQTLIEIHVDSRSAATETDVFFYYRTNSDPSYALALRMHEVFLEKYKEKRGPTRRYTGTVNSRDLWSLRESLTPKAVYIELGNIRNDWDQQRIVVKNNRQAVANWLGEALLIK